MMESFIDYVVRETISHDPLKSLVIFPTRRACQAYLHRYAKQKQTAALLPETLAVAELTEQSGGTLVGDDLGLLIILHQVQTSLFGHSDFDSFIGYGQQVLKDFNEIDRQLIDPDTLFTEVSSLKELEDRFSADGEVRQLLSNFWSGMWNQSDSSLKSSFLSYWRQLPILYKAFTEKLMALNICYEGKAWKNLALNPRDSAWMNQWDHVTVAGFYALNRSEEIIFDYWKQKGVLNLYVDADTYYTDNPLHEAGLFFRKGYFSDEKIPLRQSLLSQPKQSYHVHGCAGAENIARELILSLKNFMSENPQIPASDIVVVLADEGLLQPVLVYASMWEMPVNPSMGYPIYSHPFIHLLRQIRDFRRIDAADQTAFSRIRLLERLLDDQLVQRMLAQDELIRLKEDRSLQGQSIPELWLSDAVPSIVKDKQLIMQAWEKSAAGIHGWRLDLHRALGQHLEDAFNLLSRYESSLSISVWWKLVLHHLERSKATFEAPESEAVSLVGFLETRNIDYKAVFIAPVNEGTLPSLSVTKSLIPFSIRKAFGLPNKEEQDAVTAYHFYRLLQRASHLYMFYNTDADMMGGGERGRYLFQLQHELISKYPPDSVKYTSVATSLPVNEQRVIRIKKTDAIISALSRKLGIDAQSGHLSGLSASAINSYLGCRLRFYFDQIAGIKPENDEDDLVAGNFGNVLHKAMELAYAGQTHITTAWIEGQLQRVPELTEQAIKSEYKAGYLSGHDLLMKGVIEELVRLILRHDQAIAPIQMLALEGKLSMMLELSDGRQIAFNGVIDRLEQTDKGIRILDYKTGKDEPDNKISADLVFSSPEYKINLQLLVYALLVSKHTDYRDKPLTAGLLRMRSFEDGITWLNKGNPIPPAELAAFENGLIRIAEEMLNPEEEFFQTDDLQQCRYCDYKNLCQRG